MPQEGGRRKSKGTKERERDVRRERPLKKVTFFICPQGDIGWNFLSNLFNMVRDCGSNHPLEFKDIIHQSIHGRYDRMVNHPSIDTIQQEEGSGERRRNILSGTIGTFSGEEELCRKKREITIN